MSGVTDPFGVSDAMARASQAFFTPPSVNQSILPGWSLISVNAGNSAAPDTEQAVVAKASYGRQLGRLIDAVEALIADRPDRERKEFAALDKLAAEIRKTKEEAANARIERLRSDLSVLRDKEPAEYRKQRAALLDFLREPEPSRSDG